MMRKLVIIALVLGTILRLWLMFATYHPDIRGHNLGGYLLATKGQYLGLYDYISKLPRTDPLVKIYGDDLFIYPPLAYWIHGLWLKVPLYSPVLLEKLFSQGNFPDSGWLLLFLKIPYLVADALCLWILIKIVDAKHRSVATILWLFNLPLIYSAYMVGQLDVFMVLFMLLAIHLVKLQKVLPAAIALGISSGFKPFGLFMLPFLPGNKIKNVLVGLITYGLIIAPYLLTSPGYRMYALAASQADKIWFAKILVSGSQYLPLFIIGCVVLFWSSLKNFKALPTWGWMMGPLLVFYSVVHYHPQWFAWISPFLILAFVLKPAARWSILTLLATHIAVILSFDNSLNFGLVGLNYSVHSLLTDQNMSLVRGIMAGTALTLPWFIKEG